MKVFKRRILAAGVAGVMLAASVTAWAAWLGHRSAAAPQPQNRLLPVSPTRGASVTPLPGPPLNLQHMSVSLSNHVYYQNRVVVVTFHDISPDVYSPYVITPQTFAADLDAFHEHFNVITNQQFIDFLDGRGTVPPNAILLTFDDGYQNMYTYALPDLLQHQMQGTFFIIVGTADRQDPKKLSWHEIETMARDGMAMESHTYDSHYEVQVNGRLVPVFNTPIVVNGQPESPQQYESRVYRDFVKARTELSQALGQPVDEFAWPYGYGSREATNLAREAGYAYLFTTADGYVTARSNPLYIHRIDVGKRNITPEQAVQEVIQTATAVPVVSAWVHHAASELHIHHGTTTPSPATGQAVVEHTATGQAPAGKTKGSAGAGAGDRQPGIQAQVRNGLGQSTETGGAAGPGAGNSLTNGKEGAAGGSGTLHNTAGNARDVANHGTGNSQAGSVHSGTPEPRQAPSYPGDVLLADQGSGGDTPKT